MNDIMMTQPNLISNRTLKKLDKLFENKVIEKPLWNFSMLKIYKDYIKPNLFGIIAIALFAIFLGIKYHLKQNKDKQKKIKIKKYRRQHQDYKVKYTDDIDIENKPNKKTQESKPKSYTVDELRSIYTDEEPLVDEESDKDEYNIYDLESEYQNLKNNNNGYYSNELMSDMMKSSSSKFMFHELAKMISGNN
jgi:hypothetical protein